MPNRPASAKPKRGYEHIKESFKKQGKSDDLAEQLAAQTVDRRRSPRDDSGSPREEAGLAGTAHAPKPAGGEARRRKQ